MPGDDSLTEALADLLQAVSIMDQYQSVMEEAGQGWRSATDDSVALAVLAELYEEERLTAEPVDVMREFVTSGGEYPGEPGNHSTDDIRDAIYAFVAEQGYSTD